MVVVDAQTSANVQVFDVEALGPDLPGKAHHDLCGVLENLDLRQPWRMNKGLYDASTWLMTHLPG